MLISSSNEIIKGIQITSFRLHALLIQVMASVECVGPSKGGIARLLYSNSHMACNTWIKHYSLWSNSMYFYIECYVLRGGGEAGIYPYSTQI